MMQNVKKVLFEVFCNLITALIIALGGLAVGLFTTFSYELRLGIVNAALCLSIIILILNFRFSPQRIRVLRTLENHPVYLIEKNIARHIPDTETFDYLGQVYGFHWKDIEVITQDEFKNKFSNGSTLPSIIPHCQTFCEKQKN